MLVVGKCVVGLVVVIIGIVVCCFVGVFGICIVIVVVWVSSFIVIIVVGCVY